MILKKNYLPFFFSVKCFSLKGKATKSSHPVVHTLKPTAASDHAEPRNQDLGTPSGCPTWITETQWPRTYISTNWGPEPELGVGPRYSDTWCRYLDDSARHPLPVTFYTPWPLIWLPDHSALTYSLPSYLFVWRTGNYQNDTNYFSQYRFNTFCHREFMVPVLSCHQRLIRKFDRNMF